MLKSHFNKIKKGGIELVDVIDVKGLPDEDVKFIQGIVDFIRMKIKKAKGKGRKPKKENIRLTVHNSDVIGNLSRKEIYD